MHATTNWVDLKYGVTDVTLKYFQEHGTHSFLCKIDQGYGAGIEHKVMSGAHVYACVKFNTRTKVYAFARIYTEEELFVAENKPALLALPTNSWR